MAYSDFTASSLMDKFGVKFLGGDLFTDVPLVTPTEWLTTTLKKAKDFGFSTEKSRSERLVTPVLLELSSNNNHSFSVYSGSNMDVDEQLGLRGECDFIFSFSRLQDFVMSPIFCITEAKKLDIEKGTVQAAAQLIGAKMMNEMDGKPVETLYGCSTTGVEWRFIKYTDNQIIVDETRYLIKELPELLGVLQHIIEESKKQFPELVAAA